MTGMFRSFRARIFWAILLVAAVAAGLSLWLTREWLEERQLDEARTGLLREARVAGELMLRGENDLEVLARVRSQLRRYTTLGAQVQQPDRYVIGGIALDDRDKVVTVDGAPVSLTPSEYGILRLLMQNPGRVFSTAQIYEQVWNETSLGSEHSVAVHIRHLREKVEINPSDPRYIKVVWGLGYKIDKEARSE